MAKSKNYTITTLQNNLTQLNKPVFTQASNTRVRMAYVPYTVVKSRAGSLEDDEQSIKFPFGAFEPDGDGIKKINRC